MSAKPSMIALLGLLAVAGYQNRAKLGDMLADARDPREAGLDPREAVRVGGAPDADARGGLSDFIAEIGAIFQGDRAGGSLSEGLGDLVERFRNSGRSEPADSWVASGPNREVAPDDLADAIGEDVIADLSRKTGLGREELLARLATSVPGAVDAFTPEGRLPSRSDAERFV